jgi:AcrR family transcriptional regulator
LSEQQRSAKSRKQAYRMTKRAELVEQTRQRIVEATVELHGTIGPARTTVAAIAETAGVTRLTVYRHFPDDDTLFAACTAHWASQQRLPDVASWLGISDPGVRIESALSDVYRFYEQAEPMLSRTTRDVDALPAFVRTRNQKNAEDQVSAVLQAWPARQRTKARRALVGHALSFAAWRSLCVEQGLSRRAAVAAMGRLVTGAR